MYNHFHESKKLLHCFSHPRAGLPHHRHFHRSDLVYVDRHRLRVIVACARRKMAEIQEITNRPQIIQFSKPALF